MKTFEVYCENYSQIIQATNMLNAMLDFEKENPKENIIRIEDIKYFGHAPQFKREIKVPGKKK